MEKIYREYRDIAEFRIVYINEAHAADGWWPNLFAEKKGITEHKNYDDRCSIAEMMMQEKNITIPCVIDNMDNQVNQAYKAFPDRIYVIGSDGRIAIAAEKGPWGFKPALEKTKKWLSTFRDTGIEPDIY